VACGRSPSQRAVADLIALRTPRTNINKSRKRHEFSSHASDVI
jgi:hypothetical protein